LLLAEEILQGWQFWRGAADIYERKTRNAYLIQIQSEQGERTRKHLQFELLA